MSPGVTGSSRSTYAILGCGSVGHAVAEELTEAGNDVLILDKDTGRVEALRDQDLNATVQDISDPSVAEAVADRDILLVLASDVDANKAAVAAIREADGDQYIVLRSRQPRRAQRARRGCCRQPLGGDRRLRAPQSRIRRTPV